MPTTERWNDETERNHEAVLHKWHSSPNAANDNDDFVRYEQILKEFGGYVARRPIARGHDDSVFPSAAQDSIDRTVVKPLITGTPLAPALEIRLTTPGIVQVNLLQSLPSARFAGHFRSSVDDIAAFQRILGLDDTEVAELFHTSAYQRRLWNAFGVPPDKHDRVQQLLRLARILESELRPERIPEIIQRPERWLAGRSIFETLVHEGVRPVEDYLKRLFSYLPS